MTDSYQDFYDQQQLTLEKDTIDAAKLFRFAVRADDGNHFYCDSYSETVEGDRTRLVLTDAWTRDASLPNRFAPTIEIVCRTYDITVLPKESL